MVIKALRLIQEHLANTGDQPTLEWLAAQLTFDGKPLPAEKLAEFIQQWDATRTGSLETGDDSEENAGSSRLDLASQRQAAEQEQLEAGDPHHSALPHLMACLEEQEQQIIRNRYLRRPPLSPCQLRKAMGGMKPEQLEQLEQQALAKLRRAAQECKHAFKA